jgi:hypothetical protein
MLNRMREWYIAAIRVPKSSRCVFQVCFRALTMSACGTKLTASTSAGTSCTPAYPLTLPFSSMKPFPPGWALFLRATFVSPSALVSRDLIFV